MGVCQTPPFEYWIVGYGNPDRRDDGIGPYIVNRLEPVFQHRREVRRLVLHQLTPDVVHDLRKARMILFVDATVEELAEGRAWIEIEPENETLPCLIHQAAPSFIAGLLGCLYGLIPPSWLVSVEGVDFSFGRGLSPKAQQRAERVVGEIAGFVLTHSVKKDSIFSNETQPVRGDRVRGPASTAKPATCNKRQ